MKIDVKAVAGTLNKIMEYELAGTVRYTHYSLMTYGYNRIPIVSWLRGQATESLAHATRGRRADHAARRAPLAPDRPAARDAQARHRRHPARIPAARA
jgi:bacterioferritin